MGERGREEQKWRENCKNILPLAKNTIILLSGVFLSFSNSTLMERMKRTDTSYKLPLLSEERNAKFYLFTSLHIFQCNVDGHSTILISFDLGIRLL